ncbi:MAG: chorismate synthase [Deltaproteobacteria bacterium]|nr:chorismate synthase [Deltaproteobacteria bacterium]
MSTFARLRFLDAGESHGPKLTAIVEGCPAGFPIDPKRIDVELARRQRGFGSGGRMSIEHDRARMTAGVTAGRTTGGPIAIEVKNRDFENWREKDIPPMTTPRPGHADLTGAIKYGHRDLRKSLERASARETTMRVAVGAILKQMLGEFGVEIGGYVLSIGDAQAGLAQNPGPDEYIRRFAASMNNDLACPDDTAAEKMRGAIEEAKKQKDTLGGVFEIVVLNAPPGLGSYTHWDRRFEARLAMAMTSIQAVKGVEFGAAFENATRPGTEVHDEIYLEGEDNLVRKTNRSGGIEGGITTGAPIVIRAAMKPISTTLTPLKSVNLATFEPGETVYERSDICAVPRAVPVGEAMAALVLADALFEKLGGDSLEEMRPRFEKLCRGSLGEFVLDNAPWRFGYDG